MLPTQIPISVVLFAQQVNMQMQQQSFVFLVVIQQLEESAAVHHVDMKMAVYHASLAHQVLQDTTRKSAPLVQKHSIWMEQINAKNAPQILTSAIAIDAHSQAQVLQT